MSQALRAFRTEQTMAFLAEVLRGRRRVLEVGCGRGDVARALAAAGHEVTALDRSLPEPLPTPGVTYVEGDFLAADAPPDPAFAPGAAPFDAVIFTASLHHITPLDLAVERAAALTAPGGLVVADDFDLAAADARTLRWYYDLQQLLIAAGVYPADRIDPPRPDLVARWRDAHAHEPPLHTGAQLRRALSDRLELRERRRCEYLYRYVTGGLPDDDRGLAVASYVLAAERREIAAGRLTPVGLRLVAARA